MSIEKIIRNIVGLFVLAMTRLFPALVGAEWSIPGRNEGTRQAENGGLARTLENHVRISPTKSGTGARSGITSGCRWAVEYIRKELRAQDRPYDADGRRFLNLEVTVPAARDDRRVIVVGAHYDTDPHTRGADDNATGVAVLIVLAQRFATKRLSIPIRFVAFCTEEEPYFQTRDMGSYQYAALCAAQGDAVVGMLSLEMLGCYDAVSGWRAIVSPWGTDGDFLAFVGDLQSRALTYACVDAFRQADFLKGEGVVVPREAYGTSFSDHWSFWQFNMSAVAVTDTATFRKPRYHSCSDTPDTLDFTKMARAVLGLEAVIERLAR